MRIELLTTGSELLLGTTQNTHGAWLGRELFKIGMRIDRQITVPDGQAVIDAMADCARLADIVIVTGGLGPTSDDLTREAVAAVFGVELMEDAATLAGIEEFFAKRDRPMVPANRKQALAPVGADILPNPNGTAPGLYVPPRLTGAHHCAVFLLPGPPREMYPMYHAEVVPRLEALVGMTTVPEMRELKFVGIGESDFHDGIDDELATIEGLEVGYCARLGELDLRLVGAPDPVARGREIAIRHFPRQLVSEDGCSLEETVIRLLKEAGKSVATAESCTGGLIATRLTDVPGASEVFGYGFVTYANEAKRDLLGVSWEDLQRHGAVSEPVARQMAEGALEAAGADVAVAVTGIAGPTGGSEEKPVGTVFLAVAETGGPTRVVRQLHPRGRSAFRRAVSQAALDMVRRALVKNVAQACSLREVPGQSSGPVFRPFQEDGPIARTRRRLPHWQQPGATHYVTFRLGDSTPKSALEAWERERMEWLALRGIKVETGKPTSIEGLPPGHRREYMQRFGTWFQDQLDQCHGKCVLRTPANAEVMVSAMKHFDKERYDLGDFVVMPNHVHVLLVPREGHQLSDILKSWKRFASSQINAREGLKGPLWQSENFDHIVRSVRQLERIREYIAQNPEVARLRKGEFLHEAVEWKIE